jgi:cell division transport system permease protein
MLSRLRYTLRETFNSFRRNATLTLAAIITAAISLLGVGLTMLSQRGFDNLLARWEGGVEMIVYVNAGASPEQLDLIETALGNAQGSGTFVESWEYCPAECSYEEAQRVLAGEPGTLALLTPENVPTQFKVVPTEGTDVELLKQLEVAFSELPNVRQVAFAEDEIALIAQLKDFLGFRLWILVAALLFAAVLLIWNTIRTAIFARRREIEVMKLVGATDWFIRTPFMLEGLLHGLIGGALACGGLWLWNTQWTSGVENFPPGSGFAAMVVTDGYDTFVMLTMLGIGALAGAIGAGIAASKFLDV